MRNGGDVLYGIDFHSCRGNSSDSGFSSGSRSVDSDFDFLHAECFRFLRRISCDNLSCICCALAVKPQVILLDEPMVGLDPAAIKKLKEVVVDLKSRGTTVLISTHMLEMVENLWDVMFVMEKGHIIGSYTKEDAEGRDLDDLFFAMTGGEKE